MLEEEWIFLRLFHVFAITSTQHWLTVLELDLSGFAIFVENELYVVLFGPSNDSPDGHVKDVTWSSTPYEGSDISTGSQTPESVTTPTDVFDSGIAGGMGNSADGDNA